MSTNPQPGEHGRFGAYGGRYAPETLMHPLEELERAYFAARQDPEFQREFAYLLKHYVNNLDIAKVYLVISKM